MISAGKSSTVSRGSRVNSVGLASIAGLLGGTIGGVVAEVIQINEDAEADSFYRFFGGSIPIATAIWFLFGMLGVGLSLAFIDGLRARNVEKSFFDVFRALPLVALGGLLAGWIAQSVFSEIAGESRGSMRTARIIGWGIAGLIGGSAVGFGYRSMTRARNGAIGGLAGGIVAGFLFDPVAEAFSSNSAVLPRILGFALIGTLMGAGITYINSVTSSASLRLLTNEGLGPEILLFDQVSTIGCARQSTVLVNKDPAVNEEHVRLEKIGSQISFTCIRNAPAIEHNGVPATTGLLSNGDTIRVGNFTTFQLFITKQKNASLSVTTVSAPSSAPQQARASIPMRGSNTANPLSTPEKLSPSRPTIQVNKRD